MNLIKNLKNGTLLVAEPLLGMDMVFGRAVVLISDFNDSGTVGFVINKPLTYTVNDLVPDLECHFQVFNGGPVEQNNLYFLHTLPDLIPNSIEISDGIYWGGDFDEVKQLFSQQEIDKSQIRFFLGYSGWSKGQLEEEIENNSWLVFDNFHKNKIFEVPASELWKDKIAKMGGEYLLWTNAPENPILN